MCPSLPPRPRPPPVFWRWPTHTHAPLSLPQTHLLRRGDRKGQSLLNSITPQVQHREKQAFLHAKSAQMLRLQEGGAQPPGTPKSPATPKRRAFTVLSGNTIAGSPGGSRASPAPAAPLTRPPDGVVGAAAQCRSGSAFLVLDDSTGAREEGSFADSMPRGGAGGGSACLSPRPAWLEAAIVARSEQAKAEARDEVAGSNTETAISGRGVQVRGQGIWPGEEECKEAPSCQPAEQPAKAVAALSDEGEGGGLQELSLVERLAQRQREINLEQDRDEAQQHLGKEELVPQPSAPVLRAIDLCGGSNRCDSRECRSRFVIVLGLAGKCG
jgi:hypothetical protein